LGYLYALIHQEFRTLHDVISDTDVVPVFESSSLEISPKETMRESEVVIQRIGIAKARTEGPAATVIQLPTKPKGDNKDKKRAA
jgi:hypothetical protein